jgi:ankyrin repeat protein
MRVIPYTGGFLKQMSSARSLSDTTPKSAIEIKYGIKLSRSESDDSFKYSKTHASNYAIQKMINRGEDINLQDKYGWTLLMLAARYSLQSAVKMLIDAGANVNIQDNNGWTALMIACEYSRTDTETGLARV